MNGQQAGERVVSYSNWGRNIDGFVTRMEQDITSGAVTAAITVVGLELPAQTAVGYAGQMFAAEEVIFLIDLVIDRTETDVLLGNSKGYIKPGTSTG